MSMPQPLAPRNYTRQDVERIVLERAKVTFNVDVTLETNLTEAGVDSITYYELEAQIEEVLGITFSYGEYQQIHTLRDLVKATCRHLNIT